MSATDPDLPAFEGAATVLVDGDVVIATGDDTRYQIASVSKQFVAVTLLGLAERGALSLEQPVTDWLPELGPRFAEVTARQLLTHSAGVTHWTREMAGLWIADPVTPAERISILARTPLLSAPGTRWHYSSPGYVLAVALAERAGGAAYADLLGEHLAAAGISSTTVGPPLGAATATGQRADGPVPADELASTRGTGYLWSTTADLARWTSALHGGLVSPALHEQLVHPHVRLDEPPSPTGLVADAYGLGLFLGTAAGRPAWFHTGDNPGFAAVTVHLPEQRASLAVASNHEDTDTATLCDALVAAAGL